jgi:ethanolamine ammonia-lyase small subunit
MGLTTARIGIGHAGARYRTGTYLRLRVDHALSQDAVLSEPGPAFLERLGLPQLKTRCRDKAEYLARPDRGRQLDDESRARLREVVREPPDVLIAASEGLSAAAIEANLADLLPPLLQGLKANGRSLAGPVYVRYARVGVTEDLGAITGAAVVCLLVGERPGLVMFDSLSAYLTYRPGLHTKEADRTCVSNIHAHGLIAAEAVAYLAGLCQRIVTAQKAGIHLAQ